MVAGDSTRRSNQRARTERALIDACRKHMLEGGQLTMPEVANTALVSEATAYRYFPDLTSLLARAFDEGWAPPEEALASVEASNDPAERVANATRYLLTGIVQRQGAVRAVIAGTITRPGDVKRIRPGRRFGLIDEALRPFARKLDPVVDQQLRRDLAVVMGAEALFILTDLVGLDIKEAIESACATAVTLTRAAFGQRTSERRSHGR